MKHRLRRLLSLLLAVCIVLSLITGMLLVVSAATNQGVRDVTCTALSSDALSYYTGNYTYATLKATSGASNTSTSYDAAQNNNLYNALHTLMTDTHTNQSVVYSGYGSTSLATYWAETDAENGSSTYLYFYTDILANDSSVSSMQLNREHVWPQSHASYFQLGGGADLHHLRPSISGVNQSKSNRTFANLNGDGKAYQINDQDVIWTGAKDGINDGVLEVRDNVKGDVARILLYVYVRWQQPNLYSDVASSLLPVPDSDDGSDGNSGYRAIEDLNTLLQWMQTDPVDNWEMGRNDATQAIQGNRNVFIDYPELAWYMFGMTPPSSMATPSGDAANNGVSYAITNVNVNNPSYGTATITNSNTVTVTPAAGYYVQSATSTSGTVSINGNVITVSGMTANATVSVVLARSVTYTISFSVPAGVTQGSISGAENSSFLLPTPTGSPTANAHNYEFIGWVSGSVNDAVTPPSFLAPGASYTITGNATLTALYRYPDETVSGNYVKVTSDSELTDGQYLIVNGDAGRAMDASKEIAVGSGTNYVAVTISNDAIESTATVDGYAFTYDATAGTFATPGGLYICRASGDSGGAVETTSTASEAANTVSISDGSASIVCGTYYLRYNSNGYFRYYTSASQKAIQLYKQESGANHYTTVLLNACSHNYGAWSSNNDGTHSRTCSLCGDVATESCSYTTAVSGLTTTYTCTVCGYSYSETLNQYTVSYNVRGTVTGTDTVTEGNSVNLPTAPSYTGYTFVGWATSAISPETATVPTTLSGSYTPTASITLYAVYSRLVQGGGSPVYTLVSSIANGDRVIIYNPGNGKAVKASMNGYYVAGADVTPASSVISDPSDAAVWTVAANQNGTYTFTSGSNELSADSTTSGSNTYNNLYVETGHKNTWTLATCNAANNTFFVYNAQMTASNDHIYLEWYANKSGFSAYDSSTATETNYGFQFYKYGSGDATYYTTQPTVLCEHTSTTLTGVTAATCTTAGYTGDYVCDSCRAVVTAGSTIPALGHNYSAAVTTPATCGAAGVTTYTCSRCGDTYTEALPAALGHNYSSTVTTAATCGSAGVLTYTCSRCGDTYTEAIPATGNHNYGSIVSGNNGTHRQTCSVCGDVVTNSCTYTNSLHGDQLTHTCNICGYSYTETLSTWTITFVNCDYPTAVTCVDGNSIDFPSCDDVTVNGTDYTFVGWVASRVEETTTRPGTIHTAGESYTPGRSMTYYALYSSSTDGTPYEEFRLVTATSHLAAGDEVVIAARSAAYAIQQSGTSISRTSVSKSNNNANLTVNSATVYTLENNTTVSGAWSFKTGNYYFCVSRNSITGSTSSGYPGAWTIGSIDSSNGATVMSAKRSASEQIRYLRYNNSSFSTTNNSANTIVLYKKYLTTPQVTSYTTELEIHVHQYMGEITTPATCTEPGVMTYTCSCGDSYTETIAALGHDYVEHAAQAATCTSVGWNAYQTCSRCDYTTYQEIAALGHNIVADAAVAATCTEAGLTAGEHCTRCDYAVAQEAVPALGHNLVADPAVAATCTESGLTAGEHCTRCDYAVAQEAVPALGHDLLYHEGVAATCTEAGYQSYHECTRCDYTDYTAIPALGHDLVYEDNQDGLTHIVSCSRCYNYYIAAENHTFENGVCSLCGAEQRTLKLVSASPVLNDKIDMIYAAEVTDGYSNPYVVFVFNGVSTTVTEYTTDEYNRLLFIFNDINPQCMGDNISATLYATQAGSVESYSVPTYSVRQYCVNKLADEPPIPLRAIVSNLLAYGAAAQVYMNYKANVLVTSGDDIVDPLYYDFSEYGPISGYDASFEGTAASDVYWTAASLTLTNSVAMNFRFYAESTDDLYVTFTVNGDTFVTNEFTSIGGVYEVSFTDVCANELGNPVTVSFERNGQPVGNALSYSVNTYVQSKQDSSNAALQNLVRALYLYGVSAEDYGGYVG